jgi:hypothetical protein
VHAFGTTQAAAIRSELNEIVRGAMVPLLAEAATLHDWNANATRLLMQMGDLVKTPSDPNPDVTSLRASQDNCDGICNGLASGMGCDHESASTEGKLQQYVPSAAGAASLCELEHVLMDNDKDDVEENGPGGGKFKDWWCSSGGELRAGGCLVGFPFGAASLPAG